MGVIAYFLCALPFALLGLPAASAVAVDGQQRIVRREGEGAFQLSSGVDFVNLGAKQETQPQQLDASQTKVKDNEFCGDDFLAGKVGKNLCADSGHSHIMQLAMCREAAQEASAVAPAHKFVIDSTWYMKRPKGCFAMKCSENPGHGICYFFNGSPLAPDNITAGTPICTRRKFTNGTATPSTPSNGCGTGYSAIMDEDRCRATGTCLGYCKGAEFRIGVLKKELHNDFPIGCFVHPDDGCVHYNFEEEGFKSPTKPRGTPLCQVAKTTAW